MTRNHRFAYLVQGRAERVKRLASLLSETSDLFYLTYDTELHIPGAIGIYDSEVSWAGGRNSLLELAKDGKYSYLIFLDDDVKISSGGFDEFERLLTIYRPYVGIPLVDEIERSGRWCPRLFVQAPIALDQIVQAFSAEAVEDAVLLPYTTDFDDLSWWYSCEINQYQILSRFRERVAQFNSIRVTNSVHSWNDGVVEQGSSYRGGVTREGLQRVREFVDGPTVFTGNGPWEKLGRDNFIPQIHGYQLWVTLRIALSLSLHLSPRKRIRKLKEAAYQLASLFLYTFFWRRKMVPLCLPFGKPAGAVS